MINNKIMQANKKGFTLVEIIVVLVILAVLAAVTIPSMLGFVDEAKGKTQIANARAAYLAAQMIATEKTAMGVKLDEDIKKDIDVDLGKVTSGPMYDRLHTDMPNAKIKVEVSFGKVYDLEFTNEGWIVYMMDIDNGQGTIRIDKVK